MANHRSVLRSAHWCFEKLRTCTDPQLAAELQFLARSLVRQARARLARMRMNRRALSTVKHAA
jgi:DNA-binding TFAR19-related protein (PDSD5 family)